MGGIVNDFTLFTKAFASRTPIASPETFINDRIVVPSRFDYSIHKQKGINETMQIVDEDVCYNILSVVEDGIFLKITVEKVIE